MNDGTQGTRQFAIEDSIEGIFTFFDDCYAKGWTDGLPVYPPTGARVREMLRYTDRSPDDVVGVIPPRNGAATVEKIAINAVMAGCRPEYLPVIIAAVEAMVEPQYNLYGRQTTTHPGAHLLIVHGPIRNELDVAGGAAPESDHGESKRTLKGRLGAGGHQIRIRTGDGSIRLKPS